MKRVNCVLFFLLGGWGLFAQPVYVSPIEGSQYHSPSTEIIFNYGAKLDPSSLNADLFLVRGDQSGVHEIHWVLAQDQSTCILKTVKRFLAGERVQVEIKKGILTEDEHLLSGFSTSFSISRRENMPFKEVGPFSERGNSSAYKVLSDIPYSIYVNQAPSPGKIFFHRAGFLLEDRSYGIATNEGEIVFNQDHPTMGRSFTLQHNGYLSCYDAAFSNYKILDSSYSVVDSFEAGYDYIADFHEFQLMEDGYAYMLIYDKQLVDMSQIVPGGDPNAEVTGMIIQQLDPGKNVVFQWRSWDHFEITDAMRENLTDSDISYVHGNSIEVDLDGNLLVSCREMDEVTKINRATGNIMWRLGGKNNEFTFVNDSLGFSAQHDARRLENGHITLFDNGNFHPVSLSSVKEYQLDEVTKTATLIWSYQHPNFVFSRAMGNAQRLPNGNTWINWGWVLANQPAATEVDASGAIVYEIHYDDNSTFMYRSFKHLWYPDSVYTGIPTASLTDSCFSIYPNPAFSEVTVRLETHDLETVNMELVDMSGKKLKTMSVKVWESGVNECKINLDGLEKGIYFIRIRRGSSWAVRKLLVD